MGNSLKTKEGSKKSLKDYFFCITVDGNETLPIGKENIISETKRINIPDFLVEYMGFGDSVIAKDHTILTELAVEKHFIAPGTCSGNYIFLPKGQHIIDTVQAYGKFVLSQSIPVFDFRVPVIFEPNTDALHTLTERFSTERFNRMVSLSETEKSKRYLRYAADPDVFNFLENMCFDFKQLPFVLYSSGDTARNDDELAGIIRTITFGQPDYHVIASSENYLDIYKQLHKITSLIMKSLFRQSSLFIIVDIDKSYLLQNPRILHEIQKDSQLPIIVNVLKEKTHYYSVQHQYYMKLVTGHFVQIGNIQVDFENSKNWDSKGKKRFNIYSTLDDQKEKQHDVVIIHGLITGRDTRILAGLLNDCIVNKNLGIKPSIPFELSPYQLRIISQNKDCAQHSSTLVKAITTLTSNKLRVMTDNREVELRQKIKDAGKDWVPYTLIIGNKEVASNNYVINNRFSNSTYSIFSDLHDTDSLAHKIIESFNSSENTSYKLGLPATLTTYNPFGIILDYERIPNAFR